MKQLQFVFQFALLCCFTLDAAAFSARVNLGEALARKMIRLEAVKVANGIDLTVMNLAHDSVYLQIDAGWIFPTSNDHLQPQVVTRSHQICMAEGEERHARLLTRCGNANAGSVSSGYAEFLQPVPGKPELASMLKAMEPFKLDKTMVMQNMVWHHTNGHSVATFYPGGDNRADYQMAMSVFCGNQPDAVDPGYRVKYLESNNPNGAVFSNVSEQIEGHVKVKLNEGSDCVIALLDEDGRVIKPLKYINDQQPGEFALSFQGRVLDLPKGNYTVAVVDMKGNRLGELPVEI